MPGGLNLGGQASEEVVLKACPFCGGDWLEIDTCFVHCRSCCTDGPVMDDVPEGSEEDESGAIWNAAIARKWNTRADEQQAATIAERDARIAELESALFGQGSALGAFVNLLAARKANVQGVGEVLTDLHDWLRSPTKEEVQAALTAQNTARATLERTKQS